MQETTSILLLLLEVITSPDVTLLEDFKSLRLSACCSYSTKSHVFIRFCHTSWSNYVKVYMILNFVIIQRSNSLIVKEVYFYD